MTRDTLEKAVVLARQEELVKLQLQQQAHSHVPEDVKAKLKAKSSKVKPETSADKGKKLLKSVSNVDMNTIRKETSAQHRDKLAGNVHVRSPTILLQSVEAQEKELMKLGCQRKIVVEISLYFLKIFLCKGAFGTIYIFWEYHTR